MEEFTFNDIEQNKVKAALCYLGVLWLIPFFAWRNSRYMRFHLNQGLDLIVYNIGIGAVNGLMGLLLGGGVIYSIWHFIYTLLGVLGLVFMILGISHAVQGVAKELPFIGFVHVLK